MSAREELRDLLSQLSEERAIEALDYLRSVFGEEQSAGSSATVRLQARMKPRTVSGENFFKPERGSLSRLAAEQGVRPIMNFEELLGDFWPDDETADEFVGALREWRRDGGHG